jgi:dipeptidyl-peptidase-4
MRRWMERAGVFCWCLLVAAVGVGGAAGEREQLTVEKAFDRALRDAMSVPRHLWLPDGSVLLLDPRQPKETRTLERLDPASGTRTPACDAAAALAGLRELLGPEGAKEAPATLEWPEAIAPDGGQAVYVVGHDLFLLDLAASRFRRLTYNEEEEKNPLFSPDGAQLAFVRTNDLFVLDLHTGKDRRLTRDGSETRRNGTLSWVYWEEIFGRQDTAAWWAPDSQALAFLQSDEAGVSESVFPEFEPATPKVVRQRYAKAGEANPRVRLGIVELASGKLRWAKLGEPQPEYLVRVTWQPDGRRLVVQTLDRRQKTLELFSVDRKSGEAERILREESATSLAPADDLVFLRDGRRFLLSSERDGYTHLYLYQRDGTLLRLLTPAPLMVTPSSADPRVGGGVVAVDEAARVVYFTATSGMPVAPALYRVPLEGGAVERVSSEVGTHRVSVSPDRRFFLDAFSSVDTPPGLYLHRIDGARLATVTPPAQEALAPLALVTPVFLTVEADDGLPLPAFLWRPRDFDPGKKYPVIVQVYGGPAAPQVRNVWQRDVLFTNVLLEAGFVVFTIDPRSAAGVSKTLADTSYGKLMSAFEVPDILAGVRYLTSQRWVDAQRIGVWGWSGGGTMTLQLLTHSGVFKAGIAVAPVTDFRYYDTVWTEARLGLPAENPEGYRAGSPANFAKELKGRLLLVHGTGDDNVHPQNSWRFARELQLAKIPFEMMIYPLEQHGLRGTSIHVHSTMLDFWKRNL